MIRVITPGGCDYNLHESHDLIQESLLTQHQIIIYRGFVHAQWIAVYVILHMGDVGSYDSNRVEKYFLQPMLYIGQQWPEIQVTHNGKVYIKVWVNQTKMNKLGHKPICPSMRNQRKCGPTSVHTPCWESIDQPQIPSQGCTFHLCLCLYNISFCLEDLGVHYFIILLVSSMPGIYNCLIFPACNKFWHNSRK
jgi:hypothetical protein